jgi:hypothetical protein
VLNRRFNVTASDRCHQRRALIGICESLVAFQSRPEPKLPKKMASSAGVKVLALQMGRKCHRPTVAHGIDLVTS